MVPADGLIVVDSLEAWAPRGDKQALGLLRVLRAHPARVKLVVAATNAAGRVAGAGELERAGDATVFVERTRICVGKCRWTVGATWARHGPAGLEVERLSDASEPEAAPATVPSAPSLTPAMEPDFSLNAIELAARWSVREIEAYRARLRALGVPKETMLGWDRAVDEQKAAQRAAVPEPSEIEATPLSESTRAAGARLFRLWPWKDSVRASVIAQALLAPGLDELGDALRALLGASEGAILTAGEVGNALKILRDVNLDGVKLTRNLDRKGIARWRVTSCEPEA
jgi:hypothetical protein